MRSWWESLGIISKFISWHGWEHDHQFINCNSTWLFDFWTIVTLVNIWAWDVKWWQKRGGTLGDGGLLFPPKSLLFKVKFSPHSSFLLHLFIFLEVLHLSEAFFLVFRSSSTCKFSYFCLALFFCFTFSSFVHLAIKCHKQTFPIS